MCGRYLTPDETAFERHWGLAAPPNYFQSYNVAPTQLAPVLRLDDDGRLDAAMMIWGFQPAWAKRAWINARSETVFSSKAFASSARKRRCLVAAAGWYEWQGQKAPKQAYVCHLSGFRPMAFAGIWTGRETEQGWEHSFAILTGDAHGSLREIHPRQPVALKPEHYDGWISDATAAAELETLLRETLGNVEAYPVSSYVNKPAHNDAACIRPLH